MFGSRLSQQRGNATRALNKAKSWLTGISVALLAACSMPESDNTGAINAKTVATQDSATRPSNPPP
jgi:hypothetical protein